MSDDMLADAGPFTEVFRHIGMNAADFIAVFDRYAQTIENPAAGGSESGQIGIGEFEAIAGRIIFIGGKIGEDIGHIHIAGAAIAPHRIMQPHIGDSGFLKGRDRNPMGHRAVVDAVQRLDAAFGVQKVHGYLFHEKTSLRISM